MKKYRLEIFVKCGSFIDFEEDNEGKQILSIIVSIFIN